MALSRLKHRRVWRDSGLLLPCVRAHMAHVSWSAFSLSTNSRWDHSPAIMVPPKASSLLLWQLLGFMAITTHLSFLVKNKTLVSKVKVIPSIPSLWTSYQQFGFYQNNGASDIFPFLALFSFLVRVKPHHQHHHYFPNVSVSLTDDIYNYLNCC